MFDFLITGIRQGKKLWELGRILTLYGYTEAVLSMLTFLRMLKKYFY